MKFSQLERFKDAMGGDRVRFSILVGEQKKPCLTCGELTEYIDIGSEAHFCSDECLNKFYKNLEAEVNCDIEL